MNYNLTLTEIYRRLCTLGIPVAYMQFKEEPDPPVCVYYETESRIYGADDQNLIEKKRIRIEIYTEGKMPELEEKVEALFPNSEISKECGEFIETEGLQETAYEFETINKKLEV